MAQSHEVIPEVPSHATHARPCHQRLRHPDSPLRGLARRRPASRLGLVGPNGVGKTTLLRLLAGLDAARHRRGLAHAGDARRRLPPAGARRARRERPCSATSRAGRGVAASERALEAAAAAARARRRTQALRTPPRSNGCRARRRRPRGRARTVSAELGLTTRLDRPLAALSGGEARAPRSPRSCSRASTSSSSTSRRTISTSTGSSGWSGSSGRSTAALVVVSHDRAFLDRTVTRIVELDPWKHGVRRVGGRLERVRGRPRRGARGRLRRVRAGRGPAPRAGRAARAPPHRGTVGRRDGRPARHARPDDEGAPGGGAARAHGRPGQAVRAVGASPRRCARASGRAGTSPGSKAPSAGAARSGSARSTSTSGRGERLAITGRNGSGKSTLLALLLGELPLVSGRRDARPAHGRRHARAGAGATGATRRCRPLRRAHGPPR